MGGRSKQQQKLTKEEKIANRIAKIKPSDAVLQLPHYPTNSQKVWWNRYIGAPFKEALASKGQKTDNAITWTRDKFIDEFCEERYPHLTPAERKKYHELIGEVISKKGIPL